MEGKIGCLGLSTFVGYLIPNPFLYKLSVLFQTIQFSMSTSLIVKNISVSSNSVYSTVLIHPIQYKKMFVYNS